MVLHVTPYAWRLRVSTQHQLLRTTEDNLLLVKGYLVIELTTTTLHGGACRYVLGTVEVHMGLGVLISF